MNNFAIYLFVMAAVTYFVRMLPMVLIKKKIQNKYMLSFLYYIPYAVLSVMTIPAIFYSTSSAVSATAGFVAALILAYMNKSLLTVAASACGAVLVIELIIGYIL